MSQLSYSQYPVKGFEGMLYDIGVTDKMSKSNAVPVQIGKFVSKAGDDAIAAPVAATDITNQQKCAGLVMHAHNMEVTTEVNPSWKAKSAVPVLKKGRMWVKSEDAITVGTSTVNVRYAGTGDKGAFRGAAVASETAVLPDSSARWITSCLAGGIAVLEIDL